jgi:hypothetical protein
MQKIDYMQAWVYTNYMFQVFVLITYFHYILDRM